MRSIRRGLLVLMSICVLSSHANADSCGQFRRLKVAGTIIAAMGLTGVAAGGMIGVSSHYHWARDPDHLALPIGAGVAGAGGVGFIIGFPMMMYGGAMEAKNRCPRR